MKRTIAIPAAEVRKLVERHREVQDADRVFRQLRHANDMRVRYTDGDAFRQTYPRLLKWINDGTCCDTNGREQEVLLSEDPRFRAQHLRRRQL